MSFFSLPSGEDKEVKEEPALKKQRSNLVEYQSSSDEGEVEAGDEQEAWAEPQWKPVWSEQHDAYYYCHKISGETTWEIPDNEWAEEPEEWDDPGMSSTGGSLGSREGSREGKATWAANDDDDSDGLDFVAPYTVNPCCVTVSGCGSREATLALVSGCGEVVACFVPRAHQAVGPGGVASADGRAWCVRFADAAQADAACLLHGSEVPAYIQSTLSSGGAAAVSAPANDFLGEPRRVSVARTLSRNVAHETQPSKVFLTDVPKCATDAEIGNFLGYPGAHVYRIKEHSTNNGGTAAHPHYPPFGWWSGKEAVDKSSEGRTRAEENDRPFSGRAVVALPSSNTATAAVASKHGLTLTTAAGGSGVVSVTVSVRRVWEGCASQKSPLEAAVKDSAAAAAVRPEGCCTVWVGGLPAEVEEGAARAVFGACGELAAVRVKKKDVPSKHDFCCC